MAVSVEFKPALRNGYVKPNPSRHTFINMENGFIAVDVITKLGDRIKSTRTQLWSLSYFAAHLDLKELYNQGYRISWGKNNSVDYLTTHTIPHFIKRGKYTMVDFANILNLKYSTKDED